MKIVKCARCGRLIVKAGKCYHCGNTRDFDFVRSVSVTNNAASMLLRLEQLIDEKKYEDALAISYDVVEWLPDEASAYWFRLLAKNRCSDAGALITHGFDYANDADLHNAIKYAPPSEKVIYQDVQEAVSKLQGALIDAINAHRVTAIAATEITQTKTDAEREIENHRRRIASLWNELEDMEAQMYLLETDCKLIAREHQTSLASAAKTADSLKNEIYKLNECKEEDRTRYIASLSALEQESNQSKYALSSLREEYESAVRFNTMAAERDQKSSALTNAINDARKYEQNLRRKISEAERIENRHDAALQSVRNFSFSDAVALLGERAFSIVLEQSGTWAPTASVAPPVEAVSKKQNNPSPAGGTDSDYFAAWTSKKK